jgi:hypothetical protein
MHMRPLNDLELPGNNGISSFAGNAKELWNDFERETDDFLRAAGNDGVQSGDVSFAFMQERLDVLFLQILAKQIFDRRIPACLPRLKDFEENGLLAVGTYNIAFDRYKRFYDAIPAEWDDIKLSRDPADPYRLKSVEEAGLTRK